MRAEKDKIKDTGDLKEVSRFILQLKALAGRVFAGKSQFPSRLASSQTRFTVWVIAFASKVG